MVYEVGERHLIRIHYIYESVDQSAESLELDCGSYKLLVLGSSACYIEHGGMLRCRDGTDPLHCRITYSSLGNIDYPVEGKIVLAVVDKTKISKYVLDLLTVVESHTAVDTERDALISKRRLYRT